MLNKIAATVVVAALVCTLAGMPASATAQTRQGSIAQLSVAAEAGDEVNEDLRANENLRAGVHKMLAEVKAGSDLIKIPRTKIQSSQRNNLSKGAKIAIGVGIAVAVVAVILVAQRCRNEQGC